MSAIASPEFVSLCHAQLRLLTQQMAESTAALYMAEMTETDAGNASNFVPIVSYPEPVDRWVEKFSQVPWETELSAPLALPATADMVPLESWPTPTPEAISNSEHSEHPDDHPVQQLVVPLVYTDVVVGLLVTIRRDRPWKTKERTYIETLADSLAAGCVLERRNQWLQGQIAHRRGIQSRQSEVFHNLLHQFRNPLTAVNTFGKLLVRRLGPEDPNQTVATGIVRETTRLRELVTHFDEAVAVGDADLIAAPSSTPLLSPGQPLLPEGKVEASSPATDQRADQRANHLEDADLDNSLGHTLTLCHQRISDVVDPILEVTRIVAAEKGVTLHAQVSRNTPLVWGEEAALSEVVSNLVDNAVKYSPAGAEVWVQTGVSRMGEIGHYQGIVVVDNGPGIPAADLERLFERYYRGVQAEGELPGTGLGLAIAQSLVEEMQGAIEVISPAAGTLWLPARDKTSGPGTVFIVWLLEVSAPHQIAASGKES